MLSTDIPATSQDWSALDTLIFSLSGWFDPTSIATVAAASLPRLTITLDRPRPRLIPRFQRLRGHAAEQAGLEAADHRGPATVTLTPVLMRLETIPIALTAFTGISLSRPSRTWRSTSSLGNNTHVFVDNISVVKRQ